MVITGCETMNPMAHEGNRLREVLERSAKTPADLAKACGVTRPAVDRYLNAAMIGKKAWTTVREGLKKLDIDPLKVKPNDVIVDDPEDLRPYVEDFSREQLVKLLHILDADRLEREKLVYFIDGLLKTKK